MSKISVTTIAGLTSGGDANKVKIESGDTLVVQSNALIGSTGAVGNANANELELTNPAGSGTVGMTMNVNSGSADTGNIYWRSNAANNNIQIVGDPVSNYLAFATSGAEKVRIDSNGNAGIGTSSPNNNSGRTTLTIDNASQGGAIDLEHNGTVVGKFLCDGSNTLGIQADGNRDILFKTNGSSRMIVSGSGNVGIGTTSPSVTGLGIEIHNPGNDTLGSIRLAGNNNTGTPGQKFNTELRHNGGSGMFQILHYGSGNSVGTERVRIAAGGDFYTNDGSVSSLSDSRVKKDITDLQDGLTIVNQLRPVTFKYNGASSMTPDDDKINYGFIADEVQAVASHYVTENTDEINGETVTDFKSLSTGRMIPMLFKAVQELSAQVETLKTKVAALESA